MQKKSTSPDENILTELNIHGERIGFKNKFLKLAMVLPRDELKAHHRKQYDSAIEHLKKQRYEVRNLSSEGRAALKTRSGYDILEKL